MIRVAVRGLILKDDRLLLVNAYPDGRHDLWCAPGGGIAAHHSLTDNLVREVHEETGLTVRPGEIALVNEFHDRRRDFHQVDIYFRCTILSGDLQDDWRDPEGVVTQRRFVTRGELAALHVKPDTLADAAWSRDRAGYDPLEPIVG